MFCTLAIFFFPAVRGPYSVTHGPTADIEVLHFPQFLLFVIILAALKLFSHRALSRSAMATTGSFGDKIPEFLCDSDACVLRC
jgi:hypothetical protein